MMVYMSMNEKSTTGEVARGVSKTARRFGTRAPTDPLRRSVALTGLIWDYGQPWLTDLEELPLITGKAMPTLGIDPLRESRQWGGGVSRATRTCFKPTAKGRASKRVKP